MSMFEQEDKRMKPLFEEQNILKRMDKRSQKINSRTQRGRDTKSISSRQIADQERLDKNATKMPPELAKYSVKERGAIADHYNYHRNVKLGRNDGFGGKEYGISFGDFKNAPKEQLRKRATDSLFKRTGYKTEEFLNNLGMLTRAQKTENWAPVGKKGAPVGAATRSINGKVYYNKGMNMGAAAMTYGFAAYMAMGAGHNGEDISEPLSQMVAFGATNIGMKFGINMAGSMVEAGASRYAAGVAGAALGGGIFGLAAYGAMNVALSTGTDSDSWLHNLGHATATKEKLEVGTTESQRQHISQRQRIYSKLSKSGLNDRGQFMGNEAMALRGIL